MSIKLEGNGVNYTFPRGFELRGYSRSASAPGIVVHGKDGETVDNRVKSKNPQALEIYGRTKSNSLASAKESYDEIANAVNGLPSEVYLVNTNDDIRIPVNMVRFNHTRLPAKSMEYSIHFKASNPFWEDRAWSQVEFTNQKIVDIPIGNAPLSPRITLDEFTANPTIVQGNWSFCSHIANLKADAITNGTAVDPYGEIIGNYSIATIPIVASKYGFGISLPTNNQSLFFNNLYQRKNKISFVIKTVPEWAYNDANIHYLFDLEKDGESDHYQFFASNGRLIFGATSTFGGALLTFSADDEVEFSGWYDSDGTLIEEVTYYGKLFQDGTEIAQTTATLIGCATYLDKLWIGTNTSESNGFGGIVDELYLFNQNMGDNWCKGQTVSGRSLEADNKVFKWIGTIATNNYLDIDTKKYAVKILDSSVPTIINSISSMSEDFFTLGDGAGRTGHDRYKQDVLTFGAVHTGSIKYRKLYW